MHMERPAVLYHVGASLVGRTRLVPDWSHRSVNMSLKGQAARGCEGDHGLQLKSPLPT